MSRIPAFLLGAALAGVVTLLLARGGPAPRDDDADRGSEQVRESGREIAALRARVEWLSAELGAARARAAENEAVRDAEVPSPSDAPVGDGAPEPPELMDEDVWLSLVSGALRAEFQRRLGQQLAPQQETRMLEILTQVRDASLLYERHALDSEDAGARRDRLTRTVILLELDRAFREEMGIGVADFVRGLDPDSIEEVPAEP